jgi:hypothetical protein
MHCASELLGGAILSFSLPHYLDDILMLLADNLDVLWVHNRNNSENAQQPTVGRKGKGF